MNNLFLLVLEGINVNDWAWRILINTKFMFIAPPKPIWFGRIGN